MGEDRLARPLRGILRSPRFQRGGPRRNVVANRPLARIGRPPVNEGPSQADASNSAGRGRPRQLLRPGTNHDDSRGDGTRPNHSLKACNGRRADQQGKDQMKRPSPTGGDVINSQPPIPGRHNPNSARNQTARPTSSSVEPTRTNDCKAGVGRRPTPVPSLAV